MSVSLPIAAAVLALVGVIAAAARRHHPFPRLGPANLVTAVRAVLTAILAGLLDAPLSAGGRWAAVAIGLVAVALDGVDGRLARRSGMASRFGARFDMEVDALLILVLSALAWRNGRAGGWVLLSGLLRYLFVAAGWLAPWLARPLPPRRRRQAICVIQIAALLLVLAPVVPGALAAVLAAGALAALAWSFLVDVIWLWRSDRREQVA